MTVVDPILNLIAAVFCTIGALAGGWVFASSKSSHKVWFNLPGYVRYGIAALAGMMAIRGVNFVNLYTAGGVQTGEANLEAVAISLTLAYLFIAFAVFSARHTYTPQIWRRLYSIGMMLRCGSRAKATIELDALVKKGATEVISEGGGTVVMPGSHEVLVAGEVVDGSLR